MFKRYKAVGIRLDSGDLAYVSCEARKYFLAIEKEFGMSGFGKMSITASNDLNEETLDALNKQGHEVDASGIGTNLITCYAQAALGCVFTSFGTTLEIYTNFTWSNRTRSSVGGGISFDILDLWRWLPYKILE